MLMSNDELEGLGSNLEWTPYFFFVLGGIGTFLNILTVVVLIRQKGNEARRVDCGTNASPTN